MRTSLILCVMEEARLQKIRPNIAPRERGRGWVSDNSGVDNEHDQKVQDSHSQTLLPRRRCVAGLRAPISLLLFI